MGELSAGCQEPLPLGNTYFMVKLYNDGNEIMAIGKGGGRDAEPPVFTCGSGWPGSAGDDVSKVEIVAGPVWLVVCNDMSGGADPCRTFMWVDPDPATEPDTTTAVVKRNSTINGPVNNVAIESGGRTAQRGLFLPAAHRYGGSQQKDDPDEMTPDNELQFY